MKYKAVLFDMDGTILDTIADIREAFLWVLQQHKHASAYSKEQVKQFFGCGIQIALTRAFAIEEGDSWNHLTDITEVPEEKKEEVVQLAKEWKQFYAASQKAKTKPYEGIVELCQKLKGEQVRIGILSNKPDESVQSLAKEHFGTLFDLAIGESSRIQRKPAPDMLALACKEWNLAPEEICLVGDTEVDIQTAKNFGCPCIAVLWGFREASFLAAYKPERFAKDCKELYDCLQ